MRRDHIQHEFVEFIPSHLEDGILYVSIPYATAVHLCCSGCGERVVTPLTPTDWSLTFDGETVSLAPSIGNWSFQCRAHYWIRKNKVEWAPSWTREQVAAGRNRDRAIKRRQFQQRGSDEIAQQEQAAPGMLRKLWRRIFGH